MIVHYEIRWLFSAQRSIARCTLLLLLLLYVFEVLTNAARCHNTRVCPLQCNWHIFLIYFSKQRRNKIIKESVKNKMVRTWKRYYNKQYYCWQILAFLRIRPPAESTCCKIMRIIGIIERYFLRGGNDESTNYYCKMLLHYHNIRSVVCKVVGFYTLILSINTSWRVLNFYTFSVNLLAEILFK